MTPQINNQCTGCNKCIKWCPADAIVKHTTSLQIDGQRCIGCGECLTVCSSEAISYNWEVQSDDAQRKVAEHALGALKNKESKSIFFSFLFDMTIDCDCVNKAQSPVIPDIGILVSTDVVAIDQATLDLTSNFNDHHLGQLSYPHLTSETQIVHGHKIGLGTKAYNLIEVPYVAAGKFS